MHRVSSCIPRLFYCKIMFFKTTGKTKAYGKTSAAGPGSLVDKRADS